MTGAPLDRSRVAELIVTRDGERQRGSGYRVRTDAVLTAAHVVDGASSVRIRFEPDLPGERTVDAVSWWADPVSDIAVVTIDAADPVPPVSFGRIEDRAAVLTVEAVGFPLWKMRKDTAGLNYRDSCHANGTVAVLSNWREGTLEVVVEPATPSGTDSSPWQGMSGSALWSGGHVVGVIAKHHPGDGLGRLAAARIDLALDRVDQALGTPLRDVLAVPAPLPGVLPPARAVLITNAYQALVAEAAPQHLHDRNWELGELVRFCAGDEPYLWWQAGPWAGKSALLAWFAQHPPDGVDVVSFFITGRWAGQSDSDAFTEALIEQLAVLVGEPPELALEARARRGHTLRLLNTAAAACVDAGRTLLLVVDGLDEDTSRDDGLGRPSIASLLPRRPPGSVRVLVASRPHPELPDDVAGDHPLRTVAPRPLQVSPYARNLEGEAKRELATLLARPGLQRDVLGLITASGGGLTQPDLEELTGLPRYELDALFGGMLGRSVGARAGRDQDERVYLFTHDTLREQAEHKYGTGLAAYRAQLHTWAERHRAAGWTEHTPTYLFRGYPQLLAALGDVGRLVALALDQSRHDRMLALTGADALALNEIVAAAGLLALVPEPDLETLLRVAMTRSELGARNADIPETLPGVWARIGHVDRAVALTESLFHDTIRAEALAGIVTALVARGERDLVPRLADEAERLAREAGHPLTRFVTLAALAEAFAGEERSRHLVEELEAAVPLIGDSYDHDELLGLLARVAANRGDHDRTVAHVEAMRSDYRQSVACQERALAAVRASEDGLAARFLAVPESAYHRQELLNALVAEVRGDAGRTLGLLRAFSDPPDQDQLHELATTAADDDCALRYAQASAAPDDLLDVLADQVVGLGRATLFIDAMASPARRAAGLCKLAIRCVEAGGRSTAARLVDSAEALLAEIRLPEEHARVLAWLARVVGTLGEVDRAAELAGAADAWVAGIEDPAVAVRAAGVIAVLASLSGDHARYVRLMDGVEATAADLADRTGDVEFLLEAVSRAAEAEDRPRAHRILLGVLDGWHIGFGLVGDVVSVAAEIGAADLVLRLLDVDPRTAELASLLRAASEERARQILEVILRRPFGYLVTEPVEILVELGEVDLVLELVERTGERFDRDQVLGQAVAAAASVGQDGEALRLIAALDTSLGREQIAEETMTSLVAAGEYDRAIVYLGTLEGAVRHNDVLSAFALIAERRGDHDHAAAFLGHVNERSDRAEGMTALAADAAESGDFRRAEALCVAAEEIVRADTGADVLDQVRAGLAAAFDDAGDQDRVERLVRVISDDDVRFGTLSRLTLAALARGDAVQARALAMDAVGVGDKNRTWRLQEMLDLLVRTGARESTEQFAAMVEDLATACGDRYERPRFVGVLARTLAALGRHEDAFALLDEIDYDSEKYAALGAIARVVPAGHVADEVQRAMAEVEQRLPANEDLYWLADAAKTLVSLGNHAFALELVGVNTESMQQAFALRAVRQVAPEDPVPRAELVAQCVVAARTIADPHHRDEVYREFADMRDRDGEHEEASRIAQLIDDPATREDALRDLRLAAIADGRETAGARRFVAEVLATKDWQVALTALGKVDLPVLQRFADEVLG